MSSVKRYEVNGSSSFYEDEKGSFVDYEDYAALEAKCSGLAADNEKAMEAMRQADEVVKRAHSKFAALADENMALRSAIENGMTAPEPPATDAYLAEVRASGVEAAIATAKNVVAQEFQYKDFETAQRVCSKFPESVLVGKVEMVEWLEDFAAQLRQGGAV